MAPDLEAQRADVEADFAAQLDARNQRYLDEQKRLEEAHQADIEQIEADRQSALDTLELNATIEED